VNQNVINEVHHIFPRVPIDFSENKALALLLLGCQKLLTLQAWQCWICSWLLVIHSLFTYVKWAHLIV